MPTSPPAQPYQQQQFTPAQNEYQAQNHAQNQAHTQTLPQAHASTLSQAQAQQPYWQAQQPAQQWGQNQFPAAPVHQPKVEEALIEL
jgi:hypothetical protein